MGWGVGAQEANEIRRRRGKGKSIEGEGSETGKERAYLHEHKDSEYRCTAKHKLGD